MRIKDTFTLRGVLSKILNFFLIIILVSFSPFSEAILPNATHAFCFWCLCVCVKLMHTFFFSLSFTSFNFDFFFSFWKF